MKLPGIMNLMKRFNAKLAHEIKEFETHQDKTKLGKALKYLSLDFSYFAKHFKSWNQEAEKLEETQQVEKVQHMFNHASSLIAKAMKLLHLR